MKISSWIKRVKRDVVTEASKHRAFNKKYRHLVERSLAFRLRILGFILLGFSLIFLLYAMIHPHPETSSEPVAQTEEFAMTFPDLSTFEEFSAQETLNFFTVSAIFAILGITCLFTSWRQGKKADKK